MPSSAWSTPCRMPRKPPRTKWRSITATNRRMRRSEEHTSELQSQSNLVCRLLLEKKKKHQQAPNYPSPAKYRANSSTSRHPLPYYHLHHHPSHDPRSDSANRHGHAYVNEPSSTPA